MWHLAVTCNSEGALATSPLVRSIILDPRTNDKSLVMTVWQWTEEFVDEHTRGGILRGGSYYQPQGLHLVFSAGNQANGARETFDDGAQHGSLGCPRLPLCRGRAVIVPKTSLGMSANNITNMTFRGRARMLTNS